MERGVKVLVRILLGAALLGLVVIILNKDYRDTARFMLRGETELSPIWQSNTDYYREVDLNRSERAHE